MPAHPGSPRGLRVVPVAQPSGRACRAPGQLPRGRGDVVDDVLRGVGAVRVDLDQHPAALRRDHVLAQRLVTVRLAPHRHLEGQLPGHEHPQVAVGQHHHVGGGDRRQLDPQRRAPEPGHVQHVQHGLPFWRHGSTVAVKRQRPGPAPLVRPVRRRLGRCGQPAPVDLAVLVDRDVGDPVRIVGGDQRVATPRIHQRRIDLHHHIGGRVPPEQHVRPCLDERAADLLGGRGR